MSDKSNQEEDYFARIDREKKEALRKKLAEQKEAAQKLEQAKLHYLKCGKCGSDMKPRLFKGVEIDVCVACGAVLLDPGELEELAGEESEGFFSNLGHWVLGD